MIAIKGMKMPNGCSFCRFKTMTFTGEKFNYVETSTCHATSYHGRKLPRENNPLNNRPNWCPLVEVKGEEGDDDVGKSD